MTNSNFDFYILEAINNAIKTVKATPMILGGVAGTGGGVGGPPGGFVGKLPQTKITYDMSEDATDYTPVSGSLLDNLNHIRYRIQVLESGGTPGSMSVYESGILVGSGITILDFGANLSVTDLGGGHVLIESTASGTGSGGASTFLELTDTPATYSGQANKILVVNGTETGITFVTASGGGDMMKSIYDTDDDGIVDAAESVPWSGITGVPSTFPPDTHNHDDRYYTETELSLAGSGGAVHWNNITNKPATYPPDAHTHDHTALTNLNTTDYYHLTAVQYSGLTDGGLTSLHTHSFSGSEVVYSGATQVHEDFTSLTNGVKNAFGSIYVIQSGSSTVFYNGVRQRPLVDYTDVGSGIVLNFAPETSGVLLLDYLTPASGVTVGSGILVVYSGSGHTIQDEGSSLPTRAYLNFVGSGVTVTDDSANNRTLVTISGGSSSGTSGTYTPTISGSTNVQSVSVASDFMYIRVGSYITVNGSVYVDPTAANTNTYVYMSLPVASNLTVDGDLFGVAACAEQSQPGGTVEAGIPEDRAMLNICPANVNGRYWSFTFMYVVK